MFLVCVCLLLYRRMLVIEIGTVCTVAVAVTFMDGFSSRNYLAPFKFWFEERA